MSYLFDYTPTAPTPPGGNTGDIQYNNGAGGFAGEPFLSLVHASKTLYVDGTRTDTYTETGSILSPFKTIMGAVNQVITNADNATYQYVIDIQPAVYAENVNVGNAALYGLYFEGHGRAGTAFASAGSP